MTPLESLLAEIEAHRFGCPLPGVEPSEAIYRLVAALRRAVELLHDNDSGYATGPCDDEIASLLRGEGGR